jgi:transposase
MNYVGVDLHKEQSWFYIMNETGTRLSSTNVSNQPETLQAYFETIPQPFNIAVESTYNWYFFVDIAEKYAQNVFLANSYELKAFAKRHKKTDKIDARLIADVLRKGYLPTVTIPDKETRRIKELLRYRMNIVKDRSRNIFRIKSLLDKLGKNSNGNFTTYKRLLEIDSETLPGEYCQIIKGYVQKIEFHNSMLYQTEKYIAQIAIKDPDIVILKSIPGIDYFSAMLIKSEIIDINRFSSFNRLCAYAGLAPRVAQSANKSFTGPLNINRRKYLQWILLEIVYHFIKASPKRLLKYNAISQRKSANTAKVIFARELLNIVFHVLKEKRVYFIKDSDKIAA